MPEMVYSVREGEKFSADTTLTVVSCATCHIVYAIPDSLYRSAKKWPGDGPRGWKLCCPLGHNWWYVGESPEEKLKRERDRSALLAAQRDQAQASAKGYKIAASRARNERDQVRRRAAAGVCPCCGRTFKQLAAHMKNKHPDFARSSD